jgi:hypothetical protein
MKLPQFTLLAGNPSIESRDVAWIAAAAVSCWIAAGVRLALLRYGVNKWVRSSVTIAVFFGLFACWVLVAWRLWT